MCLLLSHETTGEFPRGLPISHETTGEFPRYLPISHETTGDFPGYLPILHETTRDFPGYLPILHEATRDFPRYLPILHEAAGRGFKGKTEELIVWGNLFSVFLFRVFDSTWMVEGFTERDFYCFKIFIVWPAVFM